MMSAEDEVGHQWLNCSEVVLPLTPPRHMAFSMLSSVAGIIGNMAALWMLSERRQGTLSAFRVLLAYLAGADLVGILSATPVVITSYFAGRPMQGVACQWHAFVMVFSGLITPLTLCILASERFCGVCFTFFHAHHATLGTIRALVSSLGAGAAIFSMLPWLGFGRYALQYPCTWCFIAVPHPSAGRAHNLADSLHLMFSTIFSLLHLALMVLILALNGAVQVRLLAARREGTLRAYRGREGGDRVEGAVGDVSLEARTVGVVGAVSLVHVVCWLPLTLRVLMRSDDEFTQPQMLDLIAVRLASLNQVLDPWVYIICHRICSRR